MDSIVDISLVCSLAPEPSGVFPGPPKGHQNIDLKQIDCQFFEISRELQVGVGYRSEPPASPNRAKGRRVLLLRGKGSWEE